MNFNDHMNMDVIIIRLPTEYDQVIRTVNLNDPNFILKILKYQLNKEELWLLAERDEWYKINDVLLKKQQF